MRSSSLRLTIHVDQFLLRISEPVSREAHNLCKVVQLHNPQPVRGLSSFRRAPALQAGGGRGRADRLHQVGREICRVRIPAGGLRIAVVQRLARSPMSLSMVALVSAVSTGDCDSLSVGSYPTRHPKVLRPSSNRKRLWTTNPEIGVRLLAGVPSYSAIHLTG